ncbi:hypothetical protein GQF61_06805 [Sphingobacterium sp. DK4209]|uniref:Uncharacterized protein n=1 Tax=Sphingobacterium zhuxiongii TaxID=2662364 RepID=A0A5Q0QDR9_9SPHI|nr:MULTISPECIES: hypothetical protein [unclassified Sphingobacterium]MVZ65561.1 hypothetical protein [Sphingobacterium sp. DK4209]QGA27686.1 hypothetical protein GFH32_15775 [Sphingobacterium sp. dk4302]
MENNYQLSRIHNYVMGLMSREEMYEMEREALNDPFLQDAIDGYKLQQGVDAHQLSLLQQRLAQRLETKGAERDKRFYGWQRLTIGTAAAVLFLTACSLVFFKYLIHQDREKTNEVMLMEEQLRLTTSAQEGSDAVPLQGWDMFNEELNAELRDIVGEGEIAVEFQLDSGEASDIKFVKNTNNTMAITIANFLQEKVRWKGKVGKLDIRLDSKK